MELDDEDDGNASSYERPWRTSVSDGMRGDAGKLGFTGDKSPNDDKL